MNTLRKMSLLLLLLLLAAGAHSQESACFVTDATQGTPCFLQFAW